MNLLAADRYGHGDLLSPTPTSNYRYPYNLCRLWPLHGHLFYCLIKIEYLITELPAILVIWIVVLWELDNFKSSSYLCKSILQSILVLHLFLQTELL